MFVGGFWGSPAAEKTLFVMRGIFQCPCRPTPLLCRPLKPGGVWWAQVVVRVIALSPAPVCHFLQRSMKSLLSGRLCVGPHKGSAFLLPGQSVAALARPSIPWSPPLSRLGPSVEGKKSGAVAGFPLTNSRFARSSGAHCRASSSMLSFLLRHLL